MAKKFENPEGEITPVELADPTENLGNFENIYNPANDIKSDPTKPGAIDFPLSPDRGAENLIDNMTNNLQQVSHNPFTQAKTQHFDASMEGTKYERYYNHPKFKSLGFNPFRDNETVYNENSSTLDEMARAMTQWHKVAGLGAMDAAGFGSLTDVETAKDFKRYMAIGSSTKEGAGAFATNMLMNTGYTVGIMSEVALEEIALAAATVGTAGLASEVTVPLMIARGVRASNKLYKGWKIGKNLTRTLDAFKDASKARKYFSDVATGAAKFMNPLENTVDFMRGMDKMDGLNNVAKTAGAFTSFYKDVRMARLAWGEAGLEGGMVRDDLEKELLAEHLAKNSGRAPTDEEAASIKQVALEAGTSTGYWNVGAIFFSNKIVFDGINKPFKNLRGFGDEVFDVMDTKIIQKRGVDIDPFEAAKKGFAGLVQTAKNPRAYGRGALKYTQANLAEGLQESAQEVIGGVFTDVAKEEWRGDPVKGGYYAAVADNLQKQMTAEGAEVFMSGFLMGGLIQPVTVTAPNYIKQSISKFRNGENYTDLKKQKADYLNKTVNDLNELWNKTGEVLAPDLDNLAAQNKYKEGMKEASRQGDAKAYHDLKDDAFYNHIYTALELGRLDTFIERLEDMKQFTPEEIAADPTFSGLSQADFITGMDKAVVRAKRIQQRYDHAQTKMKNPYTPSKHKQGTDAYDEENARYNGWKDAQKQFIFLQNTFDRTLERMTSMMGEAQQDAQLAKVPTTDFNAMFRIDTMDQELAILQAEIDSMEGVKGPGYKDITIKRNQAKKKKKLLKTFRDRMELVRTSGSETAEQEKLQQKYIRDAKRAYNSYLKNLADVSGDYAFNDALDNSYQKLVDYYMLNGESRELNNAVNEMINPGSFNRFAGQMANLRAMRKTQQQKEIRDSLKSYLDVMDQNRLMQVLYEYEDKNGKKKPMFFDPTELDALLNEGKLPKTFYYGVDLNSNDEIVRVMPNDPNLREARKIIEKFVENLTDIPIDEASREHNPYDSSARPKAENDLRSYSDLAKQYGFTEEEDSVVALADVLDTVIASEYATPEEIELAKELRKYAKDGETVTFVSTLERPGQYSISGQTVIDPRYNAENYDNAGKPIEFVILHEEIHRRTVEQLKDDREFRLKIAELREAAAQYSKENDIKEQYGLKNNEEFVAEAMSNSEFQKTLANIPYDSEGGTVWSKFVDSVINTLKELLGKDVSTTVLTEALNVITVKIDTEFTKKADTTKEKIDEKETVASEENTMLTKATPISEIVTKHPTLADRLLALYRAENQALFEDGDDQLDPDLESFNDEEALDSLGFKDFVQDPDRTTTQRKIDEYNKEEGRTVKPTPEAVTSGDSDVVIISMAMRERLVELGFDPGDYNVAQAQALINAGKSKETLEKEVAGALKEQQEEADKAAQEMRELVAEQIGTAKDLEDLDTRETAAMDMLDRKTGAGATGWTTTGITAQDIDAMKSDRKKELAFSFDISDIYEGMVVKLNTKQNFVIDKVTKKEVIGHKLSDKNKKPEVIPAAKVKKRIKYIYKRNMEDPEITTPTQPISPEAEKLSKEIQDTSEIINNKDATAEADKFGKEGGETGWLDNINECK
jgi:hypothetical protein